MTVDLAALVADLSPSDVRDLAEALRDRERAARAGVIRERNEAIADALATFYSGARTARAKALARDWSRYASTAWARENTLTDLPADVRPLRGALHRLTRLSDGEALSWAQIDRIAALFG